MPYYFSHKINPVNKKSICHQIGIAFRFQKQTAGFQSHNIHNTVGNNFAKDLGSLAFKAYNIVYLNAFNIHLLRQKQGTNRNGRLHTSCHNPEHHKTAQIYKTIA